MWVLFAFPSALLVLFPGLSGVLEVTSCKEADVSTSMKKKKEEKMLLGEKASQACLAE